MRLLLQIWRTAASDWQFVNFVAQMKKRQVLYNTYIVEIYIQSTIQL